MSDQDITAEISPAQEIKALRRRVELLEQRLDSIPKTMLLSKSQIMRSLAIVGHIVLAAVAIGIFLRLLLLLAPR